LSVFSFPFSAVRFQCSVFGSRQLLSDTGERSKSLGESSAVGADRLEERSIRFVHDVGSLACQLAAGGGGAEDASARVGGVRNSSDELAPFEGPNDLRGHHRVGAGVAGDPRLSERRIVVGEGSDAGEEDELHRREPERGEGGALALLPAVRCLPESEARAFARR
jgi:hypothetical protein